jgi:KipI family sensor histidine kinase inhibitor
VQIHRYGPEALLVEVDDASAALALYRAARSRGVRARDVVPAARTVLFSGCDPERLADELAALGAEVPAVVGTATRAPAVVEVPTTYDGPDLEDVARRWDMTVAEAVATHTAVDFVVAFCGFAPGFAYCVGLPAALAVPRHPDPRPRVPVGAVGLAGEFTGVYPTASPGGWRLLGRTELRLWDTARDEPATLPPGTRVRFVEA